MAGERSRTMLSFETSTCDDGTSLTVEVSNTGSTSISDYEDMDFIVEYEAITGSMEYKRLTYDPTAAGNDEWTNATTTPDQYQPGLWDPGETLTLEAKLDPAQATSASGIVTVAAPNGVAVTGSFTRP